MATVTISISNGAGTFAHCVIPDAYYMDNWLDTWFNYLSDGEVKSHLDGHIDVGINYAGEYFPLARVKVADGTVIQDDIKSVDNAMLRLSEKIDSVRRHLSRTLNRYERSLYHDHGVSDDMEDGA